MKPNIPISTITRQRGASLIVALVFMLLLAFLGLAAISNSTLQERMSNNLSDRNLALQAAQMALRDAERDLGARTENGSFCPAGTSGCRPIGERTSVSLADAAGYWSWGPALTPYWTSNCTDGQCYNDCNNPSTATVPVWDDTAANWGAQLTSSGTFPTIAYGTYTGATAIPNVAAQPRYIIEIFRAIGCNQNDSTGALSTHVLFRITARAVGQNLNTVVVLQSMSSP
jgi:type IV pilus assembly protein PilX